MIDSVIKENKNYYSHTQEKIKIEDYFSENLEDSESDSDTNNETESDIDNE